MIFFKRDVTKELMQWANESNSKPLILRGARQVGKTTILKQFGKDAFSDLAYFNFDEQPELAQFFEQTKDVKRILSNLSLVYGNKIIPEKTLIVFDEIQSCSAALNSLKYFAENASEYKVVAAGSLLGITLGKSNSFPVGKVHFIDVYPLTFNEFLARVDEQLFAYLQTVRIQDPIPDIFFNQLSEVLKKYFICGGMPEAASIMFETGSTEKVKVRLRDILQAYEYDFSKHAIPKDLQKIGYIWNSLPSQLGRENKKFLFQLVKQGARAREYEDALQWLIQAGLIYKVNRCNKPNIPLSAYDDLSAFKLYLVDVGLLRQMANLEPTVLVSGHRLFTEFKGALTENYILQSLITQFEVFPRYWTSEGIAEVDFLIQYGNDILPVEVKSDTNIRSKSLSVYSHSQKPKLKVRFSMQNIKLDDNLLNIPLFLVDHSKRFIDEALIKSQ